MGKRVRTLLAATGLFTVLLAAPWAAATPDDTAAVKIVRIPLDVLWQDPGDVSSLNLLYGVGGEDGAPAPPFQFLEEDMSASNPKVMVKDAKGRKWNLKWGDEARPEVFCSRIAWACGYVTEVEYFVPRGRILGVQKLKRAAHHVDREGNFADARFQLRAEWPKFLKDRSWEWDRNPFVGTTELNALRVLMMFVSNWDDKDARDADRDTNLAVFETNGDPHQFLYFVSDWGASMGRWGKVATRSKWHCKGFAEQTPSLVTNVSRETVHFGYVGQHSGLQKRDINVVDVAWLLRYLGKISDAQFRQALVAAGASPEECNCYGRALRTRVNELISATTGLNYAVPATDGPVVPAQPVPELYPAPPPQQPSAPAPDQRQRVPESAPAPHQTTEPATAPDPDAQPQGVPDQPPPAQP